METIKNAVDFKTFQSLLGVYDIKLKLLTHSGFGTIIGGFYTSNGKNIYAVTVETGNDNIDNCTYLCKADKFVDALANNNILHETLEEIYHRLPDELKNNKNRYELFKKCINSDDTNYTTVRELTLIEAKKCVMGDREQDYGTPESNFATIASFWSDYLGMNISAQQVADMMILMKISRIKNGGGTGDSYVDIAGYAACGNEILSKKG